MVGDRGSVGVEPDRVETRATVSHLQHGDAACRSFEGERQQKINTYKQKLEAGPSHAWGAGQGGQGWCEYTASRMHHHMIQQ